MAMNSPRQGRVQRKGQLNSRFKRAESSCSFSKQLEWQQLEEHKVNDVENELWMTEVF